MADKKPRTEKQIAAQFKKGVGGNPAGRTPVPKDVKDAAKAMTSDALSTLHDVMMNGRNDASRVNAAVALLNRGWGQPKQTVDVDVTHTQDWSTMLDQLDAYNAKKAALAQVSAPLVIDAVEVQQGER
jgi:hypothetical protein